MLAALARNWQVLAFRGAIATLFGLMALVWPGPALLVLVALFGIFALATGLISGILALTQPFVQPRWLFALEAVAGLFAGIAAFAWPGRTAVTMVFLIGAWALVTGGLRIAEAIRARSELKQEWLFLIGGVLTALLGVFLLAAPGPGALAMMWLIGSFSLLFGLVEIALAMRLRTFAGPGGTLRLWSVRAEEEVREKVKK